MEIKIQENSQTKNNIIIEKNKRGNEEKLKKKKYLKTHTQTNY